MYDTVLISYTTFKSYQVLKVLINIAFIDADILKVSQLLLLVMSTGLTYFTWMSLILYINGIVLFSLHSFSNFLLTSFY